LTFNRVLEPARFPKIDHWRVKNIMSTNVLLEEVNVNLKGG